MPDPLDTLTRQFTGFDSFSQMLEAAPDYSPTLRDSDCPEVRKLADAFDAAMAARGDSRRAWRGFPLEEENDAR